MGIFVLGILSCGFFSPTKHVPEMWKKTQIKQTQRQATIKHNLMKSFYSKTSGFQSIQARRGEWLANELRKMTCFCCCATFWWSSHRAVHNPPWHKSRLGSPSLLNGFTEMALFYILLLLQRRLDDVNYLNCGSLRNRFILRLNESKDNIERARDAFQTVTRWVWEFSRL